MQEKFKILERDWAAGDNLADGKAQRIDSEMTLMVKIIMNVLPEKQKEVIQTLLSLIEPPQGCLIYGVFRSIRDKNVFSLVSEWKSRPALDHHLKSDKFCILQGMKSLLSEPMTIQILTISDSVGIEAVDSARKKYCFSDQKFGNCQYGGFDESLFE